MGQKTIITVYNQKRRKMSRFEAGIEWVLATTMAILAGLMLLKVLFLALLALVGY